MQHYQSGDDRFSIAINHLRPGWNLYVARIAYLVYAAILYNDGLVGYRGPACPINEFGAGKRNCTSVYFYEFAYFSFVIGMTFQVSDVTITSRSIRHNVLLHSIISFGFNTVIVALSVNAIINT